MNLGYRYFVVGDDHSIINVSRRSFDDFYQKHKPSLPRFAGSVIGVATVIYTLENRKPEQIVRIDYMRVKVDSTGALDQAQIDCLLQRGRQLVVERAGTPDVLPSECFVDLFLQYGVGATGRGGCPFFDAPRLCGLGLAMKQISEYDLLFYAQSTSSIGWVLKAFVHCLARAARMRVAILPKELGCPAKRLMRFLFI